MTEKSLPVITIPEIADLVCLEFTTLDYWGIFNFIGDCSGKTMSEVIELSHKEWPNMAASGRGKLAGMVYMALRI